MYEQQATSTKPGKVYLVGAGPGDPKLISLRGRECLLKADVVIYDRLINPALLAMVPPQTQTIATGSDTPSRKMSQDEINELIIHFAKQGKTVVRLQGGDPCLFGRLQDELNALRAAGVPYEIVPGVTAASGASAYAEIPLTATEQASFVTLVTAREGPSHEAIQQAGKANLQQLAKAGGTLVIFMGVGNVREWTGQLLENGLDPGTPVAIVANCTWGKQTVVRTTLENTAETVTQRDIKAPAVFIVGSVVDNAPETAWFDKRSLRGQTVLITRPKEQAQQLAEKLIEHGADVLFQPAIEILPLKDWNEVDRVIDQLEQFDWLVFTSANGVSCFLGRVLARLGDIRRLARANLAAVGPRTAAELQRFYLRPDVVPNVFRTDDLARCLAQHAQGQNVLLIRADRGRQVLKEELSKVCRRVEQIAVYRSVDVKEPAPEILSALEKGQIDWVTATSPAIAASLVRLFGQKLRRVKLASISPVTTQTLKEHGFQPTVEAQVYTMDGLIEAMVQWVQTHSD